MPGPRLTRLGDLDIDQHLGVQELSWRIQRIGEVAIALFLAAALMGFFGHGPLSRVRVGDPAVFELEYSRFERRTQEATLIVRLGPQPSGVVRLWIDAPYVDALRDERVIPESERMELRDGRLVFTIRVSGERPQIRLFTTPEAFGLMRGRLGVLGGPEVTFVQFVYP